MTQEITFWCCRGGKKAIKTWKFVFGDILIVVAHCGTW